VNLPHDVEVTTVPVWILTMTGQSPDACPATDQTLFIDEETARSAHQSAPEPAMLWHAELIVTTGMTRWLKA